jgi:hypothetical protein
MVGLPASNRNCHHAMFEFLFIKDSSNYTISF